MATLFPVVRGSAPDVATSDVIVAIDGGFGAVKAGSNRQTAFVSFPSGAAPESQALGELNTEDARNSLVINGVPWVAGFEAADLPSYDRPIHRRYATTDHYRALIFEALHRVGEKNIRLLILGLPTELYLNDKMQIEHLKTFAGDHKIHGNDISIKEVVVCNQPLGTATACASIHGRIAVIDIGYRTTDTTMLVRRKVDPSGHATSEIASRTVCEKIAKLFKTATGLDVSADQIDDRFRAGQMTIQRRMQEYDLRPYLESAAPEVAATIWSSLQTTFSRSLSVVDQFLLTGGGAHLLRKSLEDLVDGVPIVTPADPVKANVEGYLQLGMAYLRKKQRTDTQDAR